MTETVYDIMQILHVKATSNDNVAKKFVQINKLSRMQLIKLLYVCFDFGELNI